MARCGSGTCRRQCAGTVTEPILRRHDGAVSGRSRRRATGQANHVFTLGGARNVGGCRHPLAWLAALAKSFGGRRGFSRPTRALSPGHHRNRAHPGALLDFDLQGFPVAASVAAPCLCRAHAVVSGAAEFRFCEQPGSQSWSSPSRSTSNVAWRAAMLVAVLFSMFCFSLELERLGRRLLGE